MKPTALLLLLCGLFLYCSQRSEAQTYESYIDSVDTYLKKRDWKRAEAMLLFALKKEPGNPNTFLLLSNLGTVHRNMGKKDQALSDYNNALAITPNAVTILHNRAALFLEMDSAANAYADYGKIMELDATDTDSRYYHGMIAMEYGKMELAKQDFKSILLINKNSVNARRGLAIWYKLNNQPNRAIELYTEVISQENRQSNYISRAECYLDLNKTQEAEADIQEAQKLDPANPVIYILKARIAELQFRFDDAAEYAQKALEYGIEPEFAERFLKKQGR